MIAPSAQMPVHNIADVTKDFKLNWESTNIGAVSSNGLLADQYGHGLASVVGLRRSEPANVVSPQRRVYVNLRVLREVLLAEPLLRELDGNLPWPSGEKRS
jgi:hypothetical protein